MSNELINEKMKFHKEYKLFKDHRKPDFDLKYIFEIYMPFWLCRQNIVIEKEIELDRFSKIILQTIQNGFKKHSEICQFLGIDKNAFVVSQFHFLIKNGFLSESFIKDDTIYEITYEGLSFLERKKKVTTVETIEFEFIYNELTLEFLDKKRFDFHINDLTKEIVDTNKPLDAKNISEGKKSKFSGYIVRKTKELPTNRIEIGHKNKPYNLDKVKFANFFNKNHQDISFYDFETNDIETHKRSICFLAFEYEDESGTKKYDIRHFKKTVNEFSTHDIEESLSLHSTNHFRKNPINNKL